MSDPGGRAGRPEAESGAGEFIDEEPVQYETRRGPRAIELTLIKAQRIGAKVYNREQPRVGPGYFLGAVAQDRIKEGVIIARATSGLIAIALRDAYGDQLSYTVHCIDRQFTVVAA
mgnify:CR=1 FL=1